MTIRLIRNEIVPGVSRCYCSSFIPLYGGGRGGAVFLGFKKKTPISAAEKGIFGFFFTAKRVEGGGVWKPNVLKKKWKFLLFWKLWHGPLLTLWCLPKPCRRGCKGSGKTTPSGKTAKTYPHRARYLNFGRKHSGIHLVTIIPIRWISEHRLFKIMSLQASILFICTGLGMSPHDQEDYAKKVKILPKWNSGEWIIFTKRFCR